MTVRKVGDKLILKSLRTSWTSLAEEEVAGQEIDADWPHREADVFAELQSQLMGQGAPIAPNKAMIAAHALSLDATLVSKNVRHFSRVGGLSLENWVSP